MTTLVWFRHDLRLRDNPALFNAARHKMGVVGVYVHCDAYIHMHIIAPVQLDFIRRHLHVLARELAKINIPLRMIRVEKPEEIAPALLQLAKEVHADKCYFNAEYPLNELKRDVAVKELLHGHGVVVERFHERCVVPPGAIRNGSGEPYKVFTAFKKKWLQTVMSAPILPLGLPVKQDPSTNEASLERPASTVQAIDSVFSEDDLRNLNELWPAGEQEAYRRLDLFIERSITSYQTLRDFPAVAGTSTLSPYLTVGAISPRQAIAAVLGFTNGEWHGGNAGAECWIGELIWRDFYQHVVVDFPQVCKRKPMQAHTDAFPWNRDPAFFKAWCEGLTGIPIVDAAMRQMNATGWMHNRLRMVAAMFLVKNCQIDWRMGEDYFMSQLIDGDFAANNGGWQWCASTGTDAAPYFRIFNPISQSRRFDAKGEFIRQWVPELAELSDRQIHEPPPMDTYPAALVDLNQTRKSTIAMFAQLPKR